MRTNANVAGLVVPKTHIPADNTAAVITLAAAVGVRHVLDKVFGGYDAYTNAEKALTIALTVDGTAVTLTVPVTCGASGQSDPAPFFDLDFNPPLQGDDNTAITITLPAGRATVAGKLNAITR